MTQAQKQSLINVTAAAAKKYADIHEAEEPSETEFYQGWTLAYQAWQSAVTLCPPCAPTDPGPPPPP